MSENNQRKVFKAGTVIFNQFDAADCAYLVTQGAVELSVETEYGSRVVAVLAKGELFGEMALIDRQQRSATARAVQDTEAMIISPGYFSEKLALGDPLVSLVMKVVLSRFRESRGQLLKDLHSFSGYLNKRTTLDAESSDVEFDRDRVMWRLHMESDLKKAIEDNQFEIYFQPIVDLKNTAIVGFEALVRWHHPVNGLVSPAQFIPVAEETGLIVPLGNWIIQQACNSLAYLKRLCPRRSALEKPLFMSINLSTRQFSDTELVANVAKVLEDAQVDPSAIKLEITESVLIEDPIHASITLERLKALGVLIAVDDFGTGYSSLNYLYRFPIDTLKIDRSFVGTMMENNKSMVIVRTLSSLAHNLNMSVVAEGIEQANEMDELKDIGCDFGQGFYFSQPLPYSELAHLLTPNQDALHCVQQNQQQRLN